jgi:hypothetical protein
MLHKLTVLLQAASTAKSTVHSMPWTLMQLLRRSDLWPSFCYSGMGLRHNDHDHVS